jgi:glycosyltransferase involved in cell wall biosynthesis
MNILFVHNNFPAQFSHLAQSLALRPDCRVAAIGSRTARGVANVDLRRYAMTAADVSSTHPFARRFDMECRRAEQVLYALSSLSASGFTPDLIIAHPGWGETLPLRAIYPKARIVVYCEFFYSARDQDVGFDPEFAATGADGDVGLHLKNATTLLALSECDAGVAPTAWQRSTFPEDARRKIHVIHEGVVTDVFKPNPNATFSLNSGRLLSRQDEVVTFVARNLEPLRGYHIFMRALPRILRERPKAQILVIGDHGTSYGRLPPNGATWKSIFHDEVADGIDPSRVHFVGRLGREEYLRALQVSSAHIYFTYPFVLSWSVVEAMSTGCVVIGSDTAPVREIIDGSNGVLSPFFDNDALAAKTIHVLGHQSQYNPMRQNARQAALARFDLERVCLPQMLAFLGFESRARSPAASARNARGRAKAPADSARAATGSAP